MVGWQWQANDLAARARKREDRLKQTISLIESQ